MRRFLLSSVLAFLAGILNLAAMPDGHELTQLWLQYEQAHHADRPQKEAEILSKIKTEAARRKLPADFYDAATQYVYTVQRRDWKKRPELLQGLKADVDRFNFPLVTFLWMKEWDGASPEALKAYVHAHPDGFDGHHPALYRGVDHYLGGALKPFIASDAEYVLWAVADYDALQEVLAGRYPAAGILEYVKLEQPYKKEALTALRDKYEGKALALFPEAQLLSLTKEELDRAKAPSSSYEALGAACRRFEVRRKAFKDSEATLAAVCTRVERLLGNLEAQNLSLEVDSTRVKVLFQNLYHANLTLREGKKTLKTWQLANLTRSYYLQDTVTVDLPGLPDGSYTLEAVSGKLTAQETYSQYTLSLALRQEAGGRTVYVADYKSGKPLKEVTLRLLKKDVEVVSSALRLNGFTPLPASFEKAVDGPAYYELEAVSGERRSERLSLGRKDVIYKEKSRVYCNIYKDRGAYTPGDTLQFKTVVYEGTAAEGFQVCKGKALSVLLKDSEENLVEKLSLKTGELGSASGRFVIPHGLRGGYFSLVVENLATDSFRVDEFVLPTFDIQFEKPQELYLAGCSVPVQGVVKSYSGHSLGGARVSVAVTRYGSEVYTEEQALGADGGFLFAFEATQTGYYHALVKVTDATGETLEAGTGWYIGEDLRVDATLQDILEADLVLAEGRWTPVTGTLAPKVVLQARNAGGEPVPLPVQFELYGAGKLVAAGSQPSGEALELNLPQPGLYTLKTYVSAPKPDGSLAEGKGEEQLFCVLPSAAAVGAEVKRVFIPGALEVAAGKGIEARAGSGTGPIYGIATLFGEDREVLSSQMFVTKKGSVELLSFPYEADYPDAVRLMVFYFRDGEAVRMERVYRREKDRYALPLSFTRFEDKTYPGVQYSLTLRTAPGTELLVAAWDKSLDAVQDNYWPVVNLRDHEVAWIPLNSVCGHISSSIRWGRPMFKATTATRGAVMLNASADRMEVMEDAVAVEESKAEGAAALPAGVVPREVFASALTFQPHLRPQADGTLNVSFRTSDKLSTYYVRAYAHDGAMHNGLVQQELVVTLPVKVSLVEPRFLYAGDVYEAAVAVSSITDRPVSGTLMLRASDSVQQVPVTVEPGGTVSHIFHVEIPGASLMPDVTGHLELTASFVTPDFSDAVRVKVPVFPAAQQLTEAHSAVLLSSMDRDALLRELRSRFVNVSPDKAELKEITVLDMVKDAIPSHLEPRGNDVLSLSEAWYVRLMASRLPSGDLLEKILACRNADGGFGWFEGLPSNAIITAVLLERFALLRERGFAVPDVSASVKFLDAKQFGTAFPYWCGWVSDAQYMRVRALYPEVPFEVKAVSASDKKRLAEFRKYAKSYLTPSAKEGRGLQGQILSKARRLLTLRSLSASAEGKALAKAWSINLSSKLEKSARADVESLLEYAVEHRDGGWYYPNAVMPWRGLLEDEAYAHALLCQLLSSGHSDFSGHSEHSEESLAIADGIRLWLMLQKETQKWDASPSFIDAITAVLDGSEAVLSTRVLALSASYEAPFEQIQAAGNGFRLERRFYRNGQEIMPGDSVKVGDKIEVKYKIWNGENRSFVRLTASREASLSPVRQLSGPVGGGFLRPLGTGRGWGFTPYGYRQVKASATEFYFDSYPEEDTVLSEEFFVTQAGRFVAPVAVIESLYAPHYRANSAYRAPLVSLWP